MHLLNLILTNHAKELISKWTTVSFICKEGCVFSLVISTELCMGRVKTPIIAKTHATLECNILFVYSHYDIEKLVLVLIICGETLHSYMCPP